MRSICQLLTVVGLALLTGLVTDGSAAQQPQERVIDADILVAGSTDSATPAAAQAARMGVKRIVVVNDIQWFGGQWISLSGTLDEHGAYRGDTNAIFPRSGTVVELVRHIRDFNRKHFKMAGPGARALTSTPMGAAQAFTKLIEPYTENGTGQIQVLWPYRPIEVKLAGNRVAGVVFEHTENTKERLVVNASMTIDATEWGDVVRRAGAKYFAGPDPKSRFGEFSAPEELTGDMHTVMNAISPTMVVTEAGRDATIPRPERYDERQYYNTSRYTVEEFKKLGFPDSDKYQNNGEYFRDTFHLGGTGGDGPNSVYTHRRAVDRRHHKLDGVKDVVMISSSPTQDYPLTNFPEHVVKALEATEKGASKKNIVDMTYEQRKIVFDDTRRHALGWLYFLQTKAHEKTGDYPESFKYMELLDEFKTPDKLPPVLYIREGMRLNALYNVRRQDLDAGTQGPEIGWNWARVMPQDAVFGWQMRFNIHNPIRVFAHNDPSQPWITADRPGWQPSHGDRHAYPLRSFVPVERDGLIGSFLTVGHSSIVSSGVRYNTYMPRIGQVSGALAAVALREKVQPRDVVRDWKLVRDVQRNLIRPPDGSPGLAMWGFHDLDADGDMETDRLFLSAQWLAVRGIMPGRKGSLDFEPYAVVTRREVARAVARAERSLATGRSYHRQATPVFTDVAANDPDRTYFESLHEWKAETGSAFQPDEPADRQTLHRWMTALGWKASEGLETGRRLARWDLAVHLWAAIEDLPEHVPDTRGYLTPGNDADKDGIPDLDDALPFDGDNDSDPDRLSPTLASNLNSSVKP